jgi:hypothetical protein
VCLRECVWTRVACAALLGVCAVVWWTLLRATCLRPQSRSATAGVGSCTRSSRKRNVTPACTVSHNLCLPALTRWHAAAAACVRAPCRCLCTAAPTAAAVLAAAGADPHRAAQPPRAHQLPRGERLWHQGGGQCRHICNHHTQSPPRVLSCQRCSCCNPYLFVCPWECIM